MTLTEELENAVKVNEQLLISNEREHHLKNLAQGVISEKDRFFAMLSHELRTPLAPVLTALQILQKRTDLPEDVMNYLKLIRKNIGLEVHLIDDLLDMNRMKYGKTSLNLSRVDVHESIKQAVDLSCGELKESGQKMILTLNAENSIIRADSNRIQQVLWNLIANALKFTEKGIITLSTKNIGNNKIEIVITDTGKGIHADNISKIFDAFEQGYEQGKEGGLGLGLAICKNLVQLHSGQIEAHSEGLNKGSTFTLTLPTELTEEITIPIKPTLAGKSYHKILLVEDNVDAGAMLKVALEYGGHSVHHALNVASAVKALNLESFDLLLSDMGLPDGSGLDVVHEYHKTNRAGKAIAITGYGMEEDIKRTREAGFNLHINKPVDLEELELSIEGLFSK